MIGTSVGSKHKGEKIRGFEEKLGATGSIGSHGKQQRQAEVAGDRRNIEQRLDFGVYIRSERILEQLEMTVRSRGDRKCSGMSFGLGEIIEAKRQK